MHASAAGDGARQLLGLGVIELENLTRTYGARRGVVDTTLSVPEGSLFGFLGPNGAGKTTTIRVLMGLLRATSGSARVLGLDAWRQSKRIKEDVGYLPGDLRLYSWLTGHAALSIFGRVRRRDLSVPGRDLAEMLELDLGVKSRQMSRGMRQKLGLVLALAHSPRLMILDEPTTTLDPLMQERVRSRLREMVARGHTVFFSSHTLGEVEALCDRVAIVKEGRLVADEPLEGLRRRSGHEVSMRFRGAAPALPRIEGLVEESREGRAVHASHSGELGALIRWLATQDIEDVSIGRPDLETLFRRFYEPGMKGTRA